MKNIIKHAIIAVTLCYSVILVVKGLQSLLELCRSASEMV